MGSAELIQMKAEIIDNAISACKQEANTFEANKGKLTNLVTKVTQDDFVGQAASAFTSKFNSTTQVDMESFIDLLDRIAAALETAKELIIEGDQTAAQVFQ